MRIYIIGASGLAKEIANYILDAKYEIESFVDLDASQNAIIIKNNEYKIISENEFLEKIATKKNKTKVVIAIGFPNKRKNVEKKLKKYCEFPSIIHPSVSLIDTDITIGVGNIVAPNCVFTKSIIIGDFNFFNIGVTIGHDVVIGNFNIVNPKTSISGNVKIGDENLFGVNSSIIQGISIGSRNTIGMGAVVIKKIANDSLLFGNPAIKVI